MRTRLQGILLLSVFIAGVLYLGGCTSVKNVKESFSQAYTGGPWAIEVHPEHKQIFWLRSGHEDINSQVIYRTSYDGTTTKMIVGPDSSAEEVDVLDLALDRERNRLYWSTKSGKIKRARLDGSEAEVIYTEAPHPTRIALDSENETLYWMTTRHSASY